MRKAIFLFLFVACISFAQYYDIAIVRANDSTVQSLVYDDNSTSYKDNSIENPDMNLRICAMQASDLQNKYVGLAYADGFDGDYIILTHFPARATNITPSGCAYLTLEISSFRAWYPSIPYVFISNSPSLSNAERWKLSRLRGWFIGNYTLNKTQVGNAVNITVTNAIEDTGAGIVPDVDYLVVGLVRYNYTTMDTGITSVNDSIVLYADSATAPYKIFINGIGPDTPPYVKIITPEPKTYTSGTIPFTYQMFDDDDIASCWYVLDGTRVDMPACGPAYILNVGSGSHSLTLYANDTTGNVGSDSVSFIVGMAAPPRPPGGGPPGTPYYRPPIVPPPPPYVYFTIMPENINITIDYPKEGKANFKVSSTAALENVSCFVRGDFENYTTVEISNSNIPANGTIEGTITVSMPPIDILDYNRGTVGTLQCTGQSSPTLISSALANVYLTINKPTFAAEDRSVEVIIGESKEGVIPFFNVGAGNSSAINISVEFTGVYSRFVHVVNVTEKLENGQMGLIHYRVSIPEGFEPYVYRVPFVLYENGRILGSGTLIIEAKQPPITVCKVPDLLWTIIILLLGLIVSIYVFRRKQREEEERIARMSPAEIRKMMMELKGKPKGRLQEWWEKNKKPLKYAALTMLLFVIVWAIVVWSLLKCQ